MYCERQFQPAVLFILLAVAFSSSESLCQDDSGLDLKAMTFNIRYDNPGDGPDAWDKRREWVAKFIERQEPDVLGMQEVLKRQADYLAAELTEFDWYGVGRDDGKIRGEYSPIFYKKDRFTLLDQGTFWLSEQPEEPGSRSWDAAITRICSWVKLKDRKSQREFFVFNTHFDHRGEEARQQSATLIRKMITKLAPNIPWVLLGDFNATPDGEVYQRLSRDQEDVVGVLDAYVAPQVKPLGPDSTWNGFKEVQAGRRIDYVFVNPAARVLRVEIVVEQRDGRFPSDHLPVVATVQWQ
jgi:endonuclease/exonuclease/phosphatase family metal-dependent hydrolase